MKSSLFSYKRSVLFVCAILAMSMPMHAAESNMNQHNYRKLMMAILQDNPAEVKRAITNKVINYSDDLKLLMAPLNFAANFISANTVAILEILILRGAKIDHKDVSGETALMTTAANGHLEAVKLLLAHGADTTLTNSNKETAATLAKRNKHYAIAKMIIQKGVAQAQAKQASAQALQINPNDNNNGDPSQATASWIVSLSENLFKLYPKE